MSFLLPEGALERTLKYHTTILYQNVRRSRRMQQPAEALQATAFILAPRSTVTQTLRIHQLSGELRQLIMFLAETNHESVVHSLRFNDRHQKLGYTLHNCITANQMCRKPKAWPPREDHVQPL